MQIKTNKQGSNQMKVNKLKATNNEPLGEERRLIHCTQNLEKRMKQSKSKEWRYREREKETK